MAGKSHRPNWAGHSLGINGAPCVYSITLASESLLAPQFSLLAIELSIKQVYPDVLYEPSQSSCNFLDSASTALRIPVIPGYVRILSSNPFKSQEDGIGVVSLEGGS